MKRVIKCQEIKPARCLARQFQCRFIGLGTGIGKTDQHVLMNAQLCRHAFLQRALIQIGCVPNLMQLMFNGVIECLEVVAHASDTDATGQVEVFIALFIK